MNRLLRVPRVLFSLVWKTFDDPEHEHLLNLVNFTWDPLLKLVQVFMDDIQSLRCVNCITWLGVICKFAEDALNPSVRVTDEDNKQYWSLKRPLRDTIFHWCSSGHGAVDCHPHTIAGLLSQLSFFLLLTQHQLSWKRDRVNYRSFPFSHNLTRIILPDKASWWRPSVIRSNPLCCWTEINSGYTRGV